MKRILLSLLLLSLALPMFALEGHARSAVRPHVAVFAGESRRGSNVEVIARDLVQDLRQHGVAARFVAGSLENERRLREDQGPAGDDILIEVVPRDRESIPVAGVGTGVGAVTAEVSVVVAHVSAEIRTYDGITMEPLDTFYLDETAAGPALTGLGVGGRDGFLFVSLPFFGNSPSRRASRAIAHEAALRIRRDGLGERRQSRE